jgi:hypothetical protein
MDPKLLLIIGGLGLALCLVLLFLGFNILRDERKAKEAAPAPGPTGVAETPAPPGQATPESAAPTASLAASPSPASTLTDGMARLTAGVKARMPRGAAGGSAHEVLRVLRDNLTGRILLELGGQRYASPDDVQDAALRQALQSILTDLQAFHSGAGEPMGPPIQPGPQHLDGAAPPENTVAAPPLRAATTPAPRTTLNEPRPLPKPTMNPFKQMAVLREIAKNPPPPTMTIAEQIDAVLQDHIQGTPLAARGIRMRPGPRGDAIFDLDGVTYTGVEELPDEAVRVVVRAAIAEWEAKQ